MENNVKSGIKYSLDNKVKKVVANEYIGKSFDEIRRQEIRILLKNTFNEILKQEESRK
jgi:hypothetical protein